MYATGVEPALIYEIALKTTAATVWLRVLMCQRLCLLHNIYTINTL